MDLIEDLAGLGRLAVSRLAAGEEPLRVNLDAQETSLHPEAPRKWRPLRAGIREQFKKKLAERPIEPRIPASKLRGSSHRYKIQLRAARFSLVCEVLVLVAVEKRERIAFYT